MDQLHTVQPRPIRPDPPPGEGRGRGMWQVWVWERIIEQNSNKIFDTIDVRKSLQIITDIIFTGPEM